MEVEMAALNSRVLPIPCLINASCAQICLAQDVATRGFPVVGTDAKTDQDVEIRPYRKTVAAAIDSERYVGGLHYLTCANLYGEGVLARRSALEIAPALMGEGTARHRTPPGCGRVPKVASRCV